jgi:hypothetical protein
MGKKKKQPFGNQLSWFDIPTVGDWVEVLAMFPGSQSPYIGRIGQIVGIETNDNPIIKFPDDQTLLSLPLRHCQRIEPPDELAANKRNPPSNRQGDSGSASKPDRAQILK